MKSIFSFLSVATLATGLHSEFQADKVPNSTNQLLRKLLITLLSHFTVCSRSSCLFPDANRTFSHAHPAISSNAGVPSQAPFSLASLSISPPSFQRWQGCLPVTKGRIVGTIHSPRGGPARSSWVTIDCSLSPWGPVCSSFIMSLYP